MTEQRIPRSLTYVPVTTTDPAAEVVHAAIVRRVNGRIRYATFTICDRRGKRQVSGGTHQSLETVTCKQCRTQLVEDGMLDGEG